MRSVRSDKAKRDLLLIYSYLAERSPQAADALAEEIQSKLKTLAYFPFMGRDRSSMAPGLRSIVVGPYLIFYTVETERAIDGRRDIDREFRR